MACFLFPPGALSEEQAAYYCGDLSVGAFRKYVVPYVPCIHAGTRKAWPRMGLDQWIASQAGQDVLSEAFEGKQVNPLDSLP